MQPEQPYRENPLLRLSYNLIAPLYDIAVSRPLQSARSRSLQPLHHAAPGSVLLSGIGTGLDLPLVPTEHRYTALDFNAAMLSRARTRGSALQVDWILGDSMALPFEDAQFDHVVLHLIVAVVPRPVLCLSEAARVLKPGGTIILFDKFLRPGTAAPLRRLLNPLTRRIATRTDVVFEQVLGSIPSLAVISDTPLLAGGWFRTILLRKL